MINFNDIQPDGTHKSGNVDNAATLKSGNLGNVGNVERPSYIRALTGKTPNIYGAEKVPKVPNVPSSEPSEAAPFPESWLQKFSDEQLERLAIRTCDGGLSDADALRAEGLA